MNQEFNKDFALPTAAEAWIKENCVTGTSILEFGSGHGSARLQEAGMKMTCVEHNPQWLDQFPGITYIPSPLIKGWYSNLDKLSGADYDLIIVDGPPLSDGSRLGFCEFYHSHLRMCRNILIDDVNREDGMEILKRLSREYPKHSIQIIHNSLRISAILKRQDL